MTNDKKDFFAHKAKEYDQEAQRTGNVQRIADLILQEISYTKEMDIIDFGSGTGLLLTELAPFVKSITAVDMSKSMNEVLSAKIETLECDVTIKEMDLSKENLDIKVDSIISSMTLHHVKDLQKLFEKFYNILNVGGTIALADLDTEDGTFHTHDTGVHHLGFERDELLSIARDAGFQNLKIQTVGKIVKPHGEYGVFLLTAYKP